MMSEPLADPVKSSQSSERAFSWSKTDPAEAALLTLAWLAKIKVNGNGKLAHRLALWTLPESVASGQYLSPPATLILAASGTFTTRSVAPIASVRLPSVTLCSRFP
jgi:hypothetical protein